ncbi:hypothetical protein [Chitinimonas sp.]|uniref:hypothetical protein n=1 Tax=Chitinimonas sp. TaxID=1934313 RepID=UPI0035ADD192
MAQGQAAARARQPRFAPPPIERHDIVNRMPERPAAERRPIEPPLLQHLPPDPAGPEAQADRTRHRETQIQEALKNGDITPEQAAILREQRREARRQRMEKWRAEREAREPAGGAGAESSPRTP